MEGRGGLLCLDMDAHCCLTTEPKELWLSNTEVVKKKKKKKGGGGFRPSFNRIGNILNSEILC